MQTRFFRDKHDEQSERPSIYTTDLLLKGNRVALRADDSRHGTVRLIVGRSITVQFDDSDTPALVDDHLLIKLADKPNDPSCYPRTLF